MGEQRARRHTEHDAARAFIGAWLGACLAWLEVGALIQPPESRILDAPQMLIRCSYVGDPCANIVWSDLVVLVLFSSISYH